MILDNILFLYIYNKRYVLSNINLIYKQSFSLKKKKVLHSELWVVCNVYHKL